MLRRDAMMFALALPFATGSPARVQAQSQAPVPEGPEEARIVLSVSGLVDAGPAEAAGGHQFTLAALEALGVVPLRTETPWTRGLQSFSGVPLERLMQAVGARGQVLRCIAINRYHVTVPREHGLRHGAVLATRLDGQPMRIRDRGPVWLIYPWTDRPDLQRAEFHERSIWQLRSIEVI